MSNDPSEIVPVPIRDFAVGPGHPLTVMCGPCIIESEDHCLRAAEFLKNVFLDLPINFIFKSSWDKANRSSIDSFRGPGREEGMRILQKVREELDLPVVTDIHLPEDAAPCAEVCEVLQIPAFLSRQTDLLVAAGNTGAVVHVKKGQFMAPWDMKHVVEKICATGNRRIILADRGTCFGYNNLVTDIRAIPIMQGLGFPVCFDATHSAQLPGGQGATSGGQRQMIPYLARAAVAVGANALFMEAHPDPKHAKSDAATVLDFRDLPELLRQLADLYELTPHPTQALGV